MTKKFISTAKLKEIIQKQEEFKSRNEEITAARRESMEAEKPFSLGRNAREDLYADIYTNGNIVQHPHGRVVQYGMNSPIKNFYRGENKDYSKSNSDSKCRSSLGRDLARLNTEAEREIEFFKAKLKIIAFSDLIDQFKQVRAWNFGTVFAYIIAQHYGIRTQHLDITDDLAVALFFACCKHVEKSKYKPVNEKDIAGDYGEYAVLFRKAGGILMNLESATEINKVLPIGYQPFTRCYKQRGYFIDTALSGDIVNYDLVENHGFEKLYFKRTPEFAAEIYELFDGGRELFHDQSMELLSDVIDQIKGADSFTEDTFNRAFDIFAKEYSKEQLKTKLGTAGIQIGAPAYEITDDLRAEVDEAWDIKEFVEKEGLAVGGRMVYVPEG